ncbi:MAG: hypothetical protein MRY64_04000 [Hyphomonadaceae bacterium]|nr:hypothetical protein [Hyphomonadaceae bacterium]
MSHIGMILTRLGRQLVTEITPALEGHYAGGKANLAGLVISMAGEAWDGAADQLSREIDGMKVLLAKGGDTQAATIAPASLKLSDLQTARDELAERLIALQVALESDASPEAAALNMQIWAFLLAGAGARMPSPPEFQPTDEG